MRGEIGVKEVSSIFLKNFPKKGRFGTPPLDKKVIIQAILQ